MSARAVSSVTAAVIALTLAACSGDDEDKAATSPPPPAEAPGGGAAPPSDPSQLPPEFIKCMAKQGYDVKSSADIHSAPPQVLQRCFGSLHQGGGPR